jgi:CubicO group peptidase (beta-lactamase class C family)
MNLPGGDVMDAADRRRWLPTTLMMLVLLGLPALSGAEGSELPTVDTRPLRWTEEQTLVGFRQMERIFPTRTIRAGGDVLPLHRGAAIDVHFDVDGHHFDTDSYMQAHRVTGVLVIKDGEIVLERYAHGREPHHRWASFSVAKSMTSTLVGAAVADGYIDSLDSPLVQYVPETEGSAYADVTIRQLLSMTSGVTWNEDYADPDSDIGRIYTTPPVDTAMNAVISYMRHRPRENAPGTQFRYNTGETDLVGFLLSRATGKTLAAYLEQKIWQPFGMESDAVWQLDGEGHELGGCCMAVTLRDYGRIGLFMLGGGYANGERVLPEGWVEEATSNRLPTAFEDGSGYGYFWWTRPDGSYQASGIFGQLIHIVPEQNLVIVLNAATPTAVGPTYSRVRRAFVDAVRAAVQ